MINFGALPCPACGTELFGIKNPMTPALCVCCRAIIVLDVDDANLRPILRYPTAEEETEALADIVMQRAIGALARYHQRCGSPSPSTNPPDGEKP